MKRYFSSGAPWETKVGYARAVRSGDIIEVSGTVSVADGKVYGAGDAYQQTQRIFEIIADALEHLDASLDDIVRTRMYVTHLTRDWEAIGKAHGEIFGAIRPATSMIEVKALIAPEFLVEIEATAIVQSTKRKSE